MKLPNSTPLPALLWDTGLQYMWSRVEERQLGYLQKILKLPEHRLVKRVMCSQEEYYIQSKTSWTNQIGEVLTKYQLPTDFKEMTRPGRVPNGSKSPGNAIRWGTG